MIKKVSLLILGIIIFVIGFWAGSADPRLNEEYSRILKINNELCQAINNLQDEFKKKATLNPGESIQFIDCKTQ